jgi:hypothetical protein
MKTIELDDETVAALDELAGHEHLSLAQLLKKLAQNYRQQQLSNQQPRLITDFAGALADSPSFQGDPLAVQQAMRDEWA